MRDYGVRIGSNSPFPMKAMHFFSIVACVLIGWGTLQAAEMRVWTDNQGRKVEAELAVLRDGYVTLNMAGGKEVRFPLNSLSEADRGFVRENAPVDMKTAARQIDQMVWDRLKEANVEIKQMRAEVLANEALDSAERNKQLARLAHMEQMTHPTSPMTDQQFLRRIYLDVAGRIPTYEEAQDFLRIRDPNKRTALIEKLLNSEAFVSHFFNYVSDLLRVREGISMGGFANLKSGAYIDWVKNQIRQDRPWDEFVGEMMKAEGYLWENPATGYLLTDFGMELCNLSNTFTTFLGTEITCAQCHDHPFEEVYQMDFYRMASFFGNLEYKRNPDKELLKTIAAKKKEFSAQAKKEKKDAGNVNALLDAYAMYVGDGPKNDIKLPFDYKYDDGAPNAPVNPAAYFGDIIDLKEFGTPREAFADWMTTDRNPRFTVNIVNRLWKYVFGIAQIEPAYNIPGHLDGQAQNYELLKFIESLMKSVDYSVKDFLFVLYQTETYQREACHASPTLEMMDKGQYHFPAPILRRLSAEQIWDSLVAMSVKAPEADSRRSNLLGEYRKIMSTNWKSVKFAEAMKIRNRYNNLGKPAVMAEVDPKKNPGPVMIRASEMRIPNNLGSFLSSFGQSDKKFIENGNKEGTIPQVMLLLNGSLTNQIMTSKSKAVVRDAQAKESHDDGIDVVFFSILSRRPTPQDRDFAEQLVRGGQGRAADYSDLIWALLNTHEFMFIQ